MLKSWALVWEPGNRTRHRGPETATMMSAVSGRVVFVQKIARIVEPSPVGAPWDVERQVFVKSCAAGSCITMNVLLLKAAHDMALQASCAPAAPNPSNGTQRITSSNGRHTTSMAAHQADKMPQIAATR